MTRDDLLTALLLERFAVPVREHKHTARCQCTRALRLPLPDLVDTYLAELSADDEEHTA